MILDFNHNEGPVDVEFDVCVVGAGAAGISIAVELSERGKNTLILEAGGPRFEAAVQRLYQGSVGARPFVGLEKGRFRGLGGTTSYWGGQILEIDDFVFRERSWLQQSGWPIPKSDLLDFYKRARALEGLSENEPITAELWRQLEVTPPEFGQDLESAFSSWMPTRDFFRLHRHALTRSPHVTIVQHATVCGLTFAADDEGQVASLRCRSLTGREQAFRARQFVLAPGGIEACRLLLQPLAGTSATAPWGRSGQVGLHFQDHPVFQVGEIKVHEGLVRKAISWFDYTSIEGAKFHPKIKMRPSMQRSAEVLDSCGTVSVSSANHDELADSYELWRELKTRRFERMSTKRLGNFARQLPRLLWHKVPYSRRAQVNRLPRFLLEVHCEQLPIGDSKISILRERDALGTFRCKVDWQISEAEIRSARVFADLFRDGLRISGLGTLEERAGFHSDDAVTLTGVKESSHHIGGLRMAEKASAGVVDKNLKLFGTKNAYVCSSAVFPTAGFVNPTHTIVALAVRLAKHLSEL